MKSLDALLDILGDGKWHHMTETALKLGVDKVKMTLAVAFLKKYGFVEAVGDYIKITPQVQQFLKEIKWIERSELVSEP
jgi:hypothetical protein